MIYGYESKTVNKYGLNQMKEISISTNKETLKLLALFLMENADRLDSATDNDWHLHIPEELQRLLGCDVVLLAGK